MIFNIRASALYGAGIAAILLIITRIISKKLCLTTYFVLPPKTNKAKLVLFTFLLIGGALGIFFDINRHFIYLTVKGFNALLAALTALTESLVKLAA